MVVRRAAPRLVVIAAFAGACGSLLALAPVACGARTPLEVGGDASFVIADGGFDASLACSVDPLDAAAPSRTPCTWWKVAGAEQVVAPVPAAGAGLTIGDVVTSGGCGAIVGWSIQTNGHSPTLSWFTRAIGFDGAPRTAVFDHPALTAKTIASGAMSLVALAANPTEGTACIVADETGCRFMILDTNGAAAGVPVPQPGVGCRDLAATRVRDTDSVEFSYVESTSQGGTPVALRRLGPRGIGSFSTPLAVPSNRAVWSRLVFDDGSFLLDTFAEDSATTIYTTWLQRFDANGAVLSKENVVLGVNTAPVLLAKTATGALAAWTWGSINVVPLDRDGRAVGAVRSFKRQKPLYGLTLVPVPGGDVLLVWNEDGSGTYDVFTQAFAPDGSPRGDPMLVKPAAKTDRYFGVVDPTGERALLVFADEGVKALPLACARVTH